MVLVQVMQQSILCFTSKKSKVGVHWIPLIVRVHPERRVMTIASRPA
jgi:hypothetical protein